MGCCRTPRGSNIWHGLNSKRELPIAPLCHYTHASHSQSLPSTYPSSVHLLPSLPSPPLPPGFSLPSFGHYTPTFLSFSQTPVFRIILGARSLEEGILPCTVFPSGQSGPWSGPWVRSPASPAVVLKSLGQSGLNYHQLPKPAGAQATAGSRR